MSALRWIGGLLLAASACAGGGARPAAPPPPPTPTAPACGATTFEGPWLIDAGTATLTCDDGTRVEVAAGGRIRIEADTSGKLAMVDGQFRFPLTLEGCALVGSAGAAGRDGETVYYTREI